MTVATVHNQQVAATLSTSHEFYNSPHFSQAVLVGDQLLLSGVMGGGPEEHLALPVQEQAMIALRHLIHILQTACAAAAGIEELTTHRIDLNTLPRFSALKSDFIAADFPAWTSHGVTAEPLASMVVEVKVRPANTHRTPGSLELGQ